MERVPPWWMHALGQVLIGKSPRYKKKEAGHYSGLYENNFKSIHHFRCGAAVLRLASHTITCISASQ
jgi:hypothetical protein